MRTFIIGDVHGCLEELDKLLEMIDARPDDHVIFAGDLVDKGPDSAGVVRRVRELSTHTKVDLVMGNHEENHVRWMAKPSDKKEQMKRHAEFVEIHKQMSVADEDFLKAAPLFIHLPKMNVVVTHAGIPEGLASLPDAASIAGMSRKDRDFYKQMCRLRCVDANGRFVGLYETKPEHEFWADRYKGQLGHVYYGHTVYMEEYPHKHEHATGIDLGCVFGGCLCAVELAEDGTRSHTYMVQGSKYATLYGDGGD